jgi:Cu/Ag efflux pump CusA
VLIVEKQVGSDTRDITQRLLNIAEEIQKSINVTYPNVRIAPLYQQKTFIDLAIANVEEALIFGAVLITIMLFLFLMDVRTTLITMLAIPISILITCLTFAWFGLSINTMTLGGLAVAIGELVDDAIVDVENIYRRLRENFCKPIMQSPQRGAMLPPQRGAMSITPGESRGNAAPISLDSPDGALQNSGSYAPLGLEDGVEESNPRLKPGVIDIAPLQGDATEENPLRFHSNPLAKEGNTRLPVLQVVYHASAEIRNAIVHGTFIVVIVFFPVFFLTGMEGKMFAPMGVAYIVSLAASLVTSLTVTPVLAYLLLPNKAERHKHKETFILKSAKIGAEWAIRFSLTFPKTILVSAVIVLAAATAVFLSLPRDFMPPFNEGAPQVNVSLAPGTSLKTSEEFGTRIAEQLLQIDGITAVVRKTGRAQTRGSVDVKKDIDRVLAPYMNELTAGGVHLEMTGLFQSEQESTRELMLFSAVSLLCILLVLYRMFGSINLSLQIMSALPLALIGAVAAIVLTGQARSIPSLVGMISLCGIASRNGILIIDHYFHLVRHEGESFTKEMLVKAGRNRVAPVLMTMLTATLGLLPITFSPDVPGREILYPIATVIVGGLITSTLMEFFVRPALFWTFGRKTAERIIEREREGTFV